jgi:hypothetical protein
LFTKTTGVRSPGPTSVSARRAIKKRWSSGATAKRMFEALVA